MGFTVIVERPHGTKRHEFMAFTIWHWKPVAKGSALEKRLAKWIRESWAVNLLPTRPQVIYKVQQLSQLRKC